MEKGMTGGLGDDSIPGHPRAVFRSTIGKSRAEGGPLVLHSHAVRRSAWACAREGE